MPFISPSPFGRNPAFHEKKTLAFSLIELLVTVGIIALLASIVLVVVPVVRERSKQTSSINNMRQIGIAFLNYANDHDLELPQRAKTGEKWPLLLNAYLQQEKVYADPGDPKNYLKRNVSPLSNDTKNYTSYLMNGYNDLGAMTNDTLAIKLPAISEPGKVALLGIKRWDIGDFYLDLSLNEQTFINRTAYGKGSNYLFADGSVHYIDQGDYNPRIWLVNQDFDIPY